MTFNHIPIRRTAYLLTVLGLLLYVLTRSVLGQAAQTVADAPAWSNPSAATVERVSPLETAQTSPVMFSNIDCSLTTYHLTTSNTMRSGCFTETAYGLMDSDSGVVIFNGTDEGVRVQAAGNWDILLPWPGSLDLVVITPQVTDGSAVSIYRNPLAVMSDHRDYLGRIDYKQLTKAPELPLKDVDGKRLVINPQTFAYSANGAWAIAETVNGWFVRINLATLDVTRFAHSYTAAGTPGALPSFDAISRDGHYAAIANAAADAFRIYDLSNCSVAPCPSHDYQPLLKQKVQGLSYVNHVRFINDSVLTFQARSSDAASSGIYEMAPSASIPHLTEYVGLGDSYTSGEGAFDYLDGTDSGDNACHLSRNSYPLLLTHDLFSAAGGHSVACSGAVMNDVGSTSRQYRGQVKAGPTLQQLEKDQPELLASIKANYLPGYIAQHLFVKDKLPRIATVSVGGNDVGFGSLLETCVAPHLSRYLSDSTCFNTYEDRLELKNSVDRMVPKWTALYRELTADSPGVRLYVIGYPQIVDDKGTCALNVHLNKSELEFSMETIDYLNAQIQKAAKAAGVEYVDISQALKGHRLCEAPSYDVAVNGLTAGTDAGVLGVKVFGHESYHPNALGHELIEQAILRATGNLTSGSSPPAPADSSGTALTDAPKSGRAIRTVISAAFTAGQTANPGQGIAIHVSGPETGVPADTPFQVRLGGSAGKVIGSLSSGADGTIDGTATIPSDAQAGDQPIDLIGHANDGMPLDITQPIQIGSVAGDSDGDGIPDSTDQCVFAPDSGQDADGDNTDDSCDNYIGPAPATPAPPAATDPPNSGGTNLSDAETTAPGQSPETSEAPIEGGPDNTSPLQSAANTVQVTETPPDRGEATLETPQHAVNAAATVTPTHATLHLAASGAKSGTVLSAHTSAENPHLSVTGNHRTSLKNPVHAITMTPAISLMPWDRLLVCLPLLFLLLGWLLGRLTPRKTYKAA